jgi:prepilin-type N-terminal cleavage/methylation domain-containing protein
MKRGRFPSFTLIEILIVITILGLLILGVLFSASVQMKKSRDARRKMDINVIQKALEEYYDTKGYYPPSLPGCSSSFNIGSTKIVSAIPCDPILKTSYSYITDGNGQSSWFKLYARLEYRQDPIIDLLGCRYGCGPECRYNYGVSSPNTKIDECPGPTPTPTTVLTPTPTPLQYVCGPGGGQLGRCELYIDPAGSQCPVVFPDDPTCDGGQACKNNQNRCKNACGQTKMCNQ